jgi:hypothetical protein
LVDPEEGVEEHLHQDLQNAKMSAARYFEMNYNDICTEAFMALLPNNGWRAFIIRDIDRRVLKEKALKSLP